MLVLQKNMNIFSLLISPKCGRLAKNEFLEFPGIYNKALLVSMTLDDVTKANFSPAGYHNRI